MRRLVAAALLSGALTVPMAVAGSAAGAVVDRDCKQHDGKRTCTTTSVTTSWSGDQGYEHGTSNDGALAAKWCVQEWSQDPLVEYEAFATDYLVETTKEQTVVRRVRTGKVISRETTTSTRIVKIRSAGEGSGSGVTCSYGG